MHGDRVAQQSAEAMQFVVHALTIWHNATRMRVAATTKLAIPREVIDELACYVYRLEDPRTNDVFYVGKGKGERILMHLADAHEDDLIKTAKLNRIREIEAAGHQVRLIIHRHGLSDEVAYEVEAALIDAYPNSLNKVDGHNSDARGAMTLQEVVGLHSGERVEIRDAVALINIGREWQRGLPGEEERLYERTRRFWRCNPTCHKAKYAMAVARGIVRQVYSIERWNQVDRRRETLDPTRLVKDDQSKTHIRWEFVGRVAPEMRRYIGKSVAHYRKRGNQNPILWVNC